MKKILFSCLIFISFTLKGQAIFEWYDASCLVTAKIDSTKATYQQVQNAHYTLIQASDFSQPFLAYQPKDTIYLKVKNVQFECASFQKELNQMEYPKGEYWSNIKKERANNFKEECLLRERAIIALNEPKALKGTPYCKECSRYVSALEKGGKNLLALWKEIHDQEVVNALDPEALNKVFEQNWNSPNNEFLARIEVLRYGWWNCILQNQKQWFDESVYRKEFQKLMTSISTNCN
jgi:hypothetical protein